MHIILSAAHPFLCIVCTFFFARNFFFVKFWHIWSPHWQPTRCIHELLILCHGLLLLVGCLKLGAAAAKEGNELHKVNLQSCQCQWQPTWYRCPCLRYHQHYRSWETLCAYPLNCPSPILINEIKSFLSCSGSTRPAESTMVILRAMLRMKCSL